MLVLRPADGRMPGALHEVPEMRRSLSVRSGVRSLREDDEREAEEAPPLAKFAADLKRAMTIRGVGTMELAKVLGIRAERLSQFRTGVHLPAQDVAVMLADALQWDSLATLALEVRKKDCLICGVTFYDHSLTLNRKFCCKDCHRAEYMRAKRGFVQERVTITQHRLTKHEEAVRAMCLQCEPEGLCRDRGCPLRAVSPLPVARLRKLA